MPPISPEPHWTQIMTALLMPMIAILAVIIACRQWKTAYDKLRLDHFDRRFAVYDTARNLLATIMTTGQIKEEELYKFLSGTREAKWLLNDEIANYFQKKLWVEANKLQTLLEVVDSLPVGQEQNENVKKQSEIKQWFLEQYNVLDQKFAPFLKLNRPIFWWIND